MKNILKKIVVLILSIEAKIILAKYKPKIIAITGSVGKTSTKDAVYTVLSSSLYVRKSNKSYNSEIGVPLTIIGIENAWSSLFGWLKNILEGLFLIIFKHHYPKWLILETGVDRPGDMSRILKIIKPDITIFTRFSKVPVHVEFFDSPEEVMAEKTKLALGAKKDSDLILNFDDEDVLKIKEKAHRKYTTYGFNEGADVRATNISINKDMDGKPVGVNFKIEYDGNTIPVNLNGLLGKQHIYPSLAAIAAASSVGLNVVEVSQNLKDHQTELGRMRILEGKDGSVIIDDSYNSSPIAVKEALQTIEQIDWPGRKIVVLGDMMELGKYSAEAHIEIGKMVPDFANFLVTVGPRARTIADKAIDKLGEENVRSFKYSKDAGTYLKTFVREGDLVLIKGSQSTRLEKAIVSILKDPGRAKELLVRQEKEWQDR